MAFCSKGEDIGQDRLMQDFMWTRIYEVRQCCAVLLASLKGADMCYPSEFHHISKHGIQIWQLPHSTYESNVL